MTKYTVKIPLPAKGSEGDLIKLRKYLDKICSCLFADSSSRATFTWFVAKSEGGPTASIIIEEDEVINFSSKDPDYLEELIEKIGGFIKLGDQTAASVESADVI